MELSRYRTEVAGPGEEDTARVARVVGPSAAAPGTFRLAALGLIGPAIEADGRLGGRLVPYFPLPADLVPFPVEEAAVEDGPDRPPPLRVEALRPVFLTKDLPEVRGSFELPAVPALRTATQGKPLGGIWITGMGLSRWLGGELPRQADLLSSRCLWKSESRVGIGMDPARRTAEEHLLYTTEAVALDLDRGVSFLVACEGCEDLLPTDGLLRLGGDGRGAAVETWPLPDGEGGETDQPWDVVPEGDRVRIVLASPGVFPGGWRLPGTRREGEDWIFRYRDLEARLVAAAVGRSGVVSGWDIAEQRPKPAVRVAPQGSVYWLELRRGDPGCLRELVDEGLGPLISGEVAEEDARREVRRRSAEGFNQVWVGGWSTPAPSR